MSLELSDSMELIQNQSCQTEPCNKGKKVIVVISILTIVPIVCALLLKLGKCKS